MSLDLIRESCHKVKPEIAIGMIEQLPSIIRNRVIEVLQMQELANKGDRDAIDKYEYSNCHTIANYIGLGWIHLGKNHFPSHGFDFLHYWNTSPLKNTKTSINSVQIPAIGRMRVVGDPRLLHSFIVLGRSDDEVICIDNCHRREDGKSITITTHDRCVEGYIERYNHDIGQGSMIASRLGEGDFHRTMLLNPDEKMMYYKSIDIEKQKETSLNL